MLRSRTEDRRQRTEDGPFFAKGYAGQARDDGRVNFGLRVSLKNGEIVRVCIHRGSKQIAGSCVEVESRGQRLLLDLGLPLDAEKDAKQYLPGIGGYE